MGIYDREYYRDERGGFFGSLSGRGAICKWLIIVNAGVFLIQMLTQRSEVMVFDGMPVRGPLGLGPITNALLLDVQSVLHGQVWRLLTYAFLHDPNSLWHIVLNMWFLWMFGPDLEEIYGPKEFLAFYLGACLAGGIGFVLCYFLGVPGERCLGASGAISAVLLLCAMHFPNRVILLFFIIPVPIWFFLVIILLPDMFQFIRAFRHHEDPGNTAVTVHLVGALFGYLYFKLQWRLTNLIPDFQAMQRRRSRPRLRVYREEEPTSAVAVRPSPPSDVDEQLEARVDAVLEKVAKHGQQALTENERQILLRASEVYRKRRP